MDNGSVHIHATKMWVSTSQHKADPNQRSNTTYTLRLPKQIQDVVGVHISGYYFPRWAVGPSFWPPNGLRGVDGNDALEVEIVPPSGVVGYPTVRETLFFPHLAMVYSDQENQTYSYAHQLARMLNDLVDRSELLGTPKSYKDRLRFRFVENGTLGTRIEADPLDSELLGTTVRFLFASGNIIAQARSAWRTMGFTGNPRDVFLVAGEFGLESDSYADIRRVRYMDISYEGGDAMENPILRIYTPSSTSKDDFTSSMSGPAEMVSKSMRQLVFLKTGKPIRQMHYLTLNLRYPDGVDPEDLLGQFGVFEDHDLELTILHLVRSNEKRVEYAPSSLAG